MESLSLSGFQYIILIISGVAKLSQRSFFVDIVIIVVIIVIVIINIIVIINFIVVVSNLNLIVIIRELILHCDWTW